MVAGPAVLVQRQTQRNTMAAVWFHYACVVSFQLEATIDIRIWSCCGYLASGWNRFDVTVVLASFLALVPAWVDAQDLPS